MLFLLLTVVSSEPHEKPRRNNDWVAEKIHWLFLTTCHPFYIIFDCFLFVPLLPFPSDVLAEWLLYKCIDKVIFCVIVSLVNCRKYENLLQFNTSRLAFLRTWYYFRLFFWPKMDLNIRFDHRITLDSQNIHLKIGSTNIILLSTSQKETQQNFLISYEVKRKRRLMWILIGAF